MQQYLPLAVLKLMDWVFTRNIDNEVATVLTACGIETQRILLLKRYFLVATVLTACGIETVSKTLVAYQSCAMVATVLTACGIET